MTSNALLTNEKNYIMTLVRDWVHGKSENAKREYGSYARIIDLSLNGCLAHKMIVPREHARRVTDMLLSLTRDAKYCYTLGAPSLNSIQVP
jgi:hypothetical protein